MAQFETWLKSDLQQPVKVIAVHGNVFTQDNMANRVGVEVTDGGEAVTLSGSVQGYIIRADDATVVQTGSLSGNKAWVDLPESAYAVAGQIQIAIRLVSGQTKTVLGACTGYVVRSVTSTIIDPGEVVPDIADLLAMIAECEAATDGAENVNITQTKTGNEITITTTDRDGVQTANTISGIDPVGTYPNIIVGNAEQLLTDKGVSASGAFMMKASESGDRELLRKIVGGTVAWNQLLKNGNFASASNWTTGSGDTFTVSENKATYRASARYHNINQAINNPKKDHVYLGLIDAQSYIATNTFFYVRLVTGGTVVQTASKTLSTSAETNGVMLKPSQDGSYLQFLIQDNNASGWGDITAQNANLFDLTQMFGTAVADYIYSLQTATAGAGTAFFKRIFPALYYPYDAGTLKHVEGMNSHDTVGFNLWDGVWEIGDISSTDGGNTTNSNIWRSKNFIPIIPFVEYFSALPSQETGKNLRFRFYDANKNYIGYTVKSGNSQSGKSFYPPDSARYMRLCPYISDVSDYKVCINISDPALNGTYKPYEHHSYPLDSSLPLRGILKLSSGELAYDGDEYTPDGTVARKYGIITFDGSNDENWLLHGSIASWFYIDNALPGTYAEGGSSTATDLAITADYVERRYSEASIMENHQFVIGIPGGSTTKRLAFKNTAYTTVAEWKTALASRPITIVYRLETPTTETAAPYAEAQWSDATGAEYFDMTGIVPPWADTFYPENLREKIETLNQTTAPSITDAASGAIASFPDGADGVPFDALSVTIDPVQDLHGYANPWPAGGGKNLSPLSYALSTSGGNINLGTSGTFGSVVAGQTYTISLYSNASSSPNTQIRVYDGNTQTTITNKNFNPLARSSVVITPTVSGQLCFNAAYGSNYASTNIFTEIQVEAGSTATAYAPYANICPITGWTGANVTRAGKNILDIGQFVQGTINSEEGYEQSTTTRIRSPYIKVKQGSYTISTESGFNLVCDVYGENKKYIRTESYYTWSTGNTLTVNIAGTRYVRVLVRYTANTNIVPSNVTQLQMENGTAATAYEPYVGTTYPIAFTQAGTVYGGVVDVVSGVLTVDKAMGTGFTRGNKDSTQNLYQLVNSSVTNKKAWNSTGDAPPLISNTLPALGLTEARNTHAKCVSQYGDGFWVGGYIGEETALDTLLQTLTIVYPLATPVTYHLTPTQITSLLGQNNVWADTGNTAATYKADTKLYIDKRISALIAQIVNA